MRAALCSKKIGKKFGKEIVLIDMPDFASLNKYGAGY